MYNCEYLYFCHFDLVTICEVELTLICEGLFVSRFFPHIFFWTLDPMLHDLVKKVKGRCRIQKLPVFCPL